MKDVSFQGVGGLKIFAGAWRPETTRPRAVVVIVHGFNSHSGHYGWVAQQLVTAGFAVYALDHRGRGRSEGERYFVEKIEDYVEDVGTLVKLAKSREPGLPVFMLGHSAGGVISCNYALDHQAELAGLICESFAFRVYAPDFALSLVKGVSFSRDPKVIQAMQEDPFVKDEVQPTLTVAAMVRGDERLEREFSSIKLPVLIMHGTEDKVTKPEGSQRFYDQAGATDKTLKLYEGYAHDLLNDLGKEAVLDDIRAWIVARLPA
jgi:acylglycerol lipase